MLIFFLLGLCLEVLIKPLSLTLDRHSSFSLQLSMVLLPFFIEAVSLLQRPRLSSAEQPRQCSILELFLGFSDRGRLLSMLLICLEAGSAWQVLGMCFPSDVIGVVTYLNVRTRL